MEMRNVSRNYKTEKMLRDIKDKGIKGSFGAYKYIVVIDRVCGAAVDGPCSVCLIAVVPKLIEPTHT
jgi:hypothetical protein